MRNCGKSLQVPWLLSKRAHNATRRDYGLDGWATAQQESVPRPPGLAFLTVDSSAGVPSPRSTIKACINCLCRNPPPRLWPIRTQQTHPSAIGTGERRGHEKNRQSAVIAAKGGKIPASISLLLPADSALQPNSPSTQTMDRSGTLSVPVASSLRGISRRLSNRRPAFN